MREVKISLKFLEEMLRTGSTIEKTEVIKGIDVDEYIVGVTWENEHLAFMIDSKLVANDAFEFKRLNE